ncbi:MAG: glycosyltransferase family 4 protein [Candidatus Aenigmatarchaeota archaeon]
MERYVLNLAKIFSKNNEIHLFANTVNDIDFSCNIHEIDCIKSPKELFELIFPFASAEQIKRYKLDIIHSQVGAVVNGNVCTAHSCHIAAVDRLCKERGLLYSFLKNLHPANRITLLNEKRAYTTYKNIIAVSNGLKNELIQYYRIPEERINVIPNGVDIEKFAFKNKKEIREQIRMKLNVSSTDILLINIANEFGRKGVRYVIDAISKIKNNGIKFLVIGGDDPKQYINFAKRKGVDSKVIFVGRISGSEIPKYLIASDIFVFPTEYEAFSLEYVRSCRCGIAYFNDKCKWI